MTHIPVSHGELRLHGNCLMRVEVESLDVGPFAFTLTHPEGYTYPCRASGTYRMVYLGPDGEEHIAYDIEALVAGAQEGEDVRCEADLHRRP